MIVQLAGLPATGKSTLATEIASRLPGRTLLLDKDRIRHAFYGRHNTEYTRTQDDFCVQMMHDAATRHLRQYRDGIVILDGRTCSRAYQVRQAQQLAARARRPLQIIECVCDDATARTRLQDDSASRAHPAANRNFDLYRQLRARADPITAPKLLVNTDAPLADCITRCLHYLHPTIERTPAATASCTDEH